MISLSSTTVAVIPARGGSKGILEKNLAMIAGRPLIYWTIEAVAQASISVRLVVTTDSPEISTLAASYGAEIIHRPRSLALDTSPTEPAIIHALEDLGAGVDGVLVLLQATSPVRLFGTIDRAYQQFIKSGCDSLVAVVKESPFVWRGPMGSPSPCYSVNARTRRQDLKDDDHLYRETGSLYMSRIGSFIESGNRIHGNVSLFELDNREGADIDTSLDLAVTETILSRLVREKT